jgi:hypothetical protein
MPIEPPVISPNQGQLVRTYGRVTDPSSGARFWVQVNPDDNGWNDSVYLTTLIQCFKLNWGESPFFADWGIPAHQSVMQQIPPDYYMALMQQRFAPYFSALQITKVVDAAMPTYDVFVIMHNGAQHSVRMIPQPFVDGFGLAVLDGHGYALSTGRMQSGTYVAA